MDNADVYSIVRPIGAPSGLVILLIGFLAVSCQKFDWPVSKGAASGGGAGSPPGAQPAAPQVVGTTPADGNTQVPVASAIVLTFSAAINTTTALAQAVSGACTGSIQISDTNFTACIGIASASWSANAMQVTLVPAAALTNGVTYKIQTTGALFGTSGTAATPYLMPNGFTTYGDVWATKTNMPVLHGFRAGTVNGKIYVIAGDAAGTNAMYDPVADTWTPRASIGTTYSEFGMAAYNNKIYIFGPIQNSTLVLEYDTISDTWTNCGGVCPAMPTGRYSSVAVEVGGFIYVIGGYSGSFLTTVERFDPTAPGWLARAPFGSYASCAALGGGREGPGAAVYNGQIYMMGGVCTPDFITYYNPNYVEVYDPIGNNWAQLAAGTSPGGKYIYAETIGTKIYMNGNSSSTLNEYDILSNTWAVRAVAPNAINAGAAVYNGKYYGFCATTNPSTFVYSPP